MSDLIDVCMKDHHSRTDTRRIYLTGWSAGGSGSFKLVRGFLRKGKYFAAINRVAGQSASILAEGAVQKTAIWMHIGLRDTPLRVQVSRDLYAHLKNHPSNASAVETTVNDTIKHGDSDVVRHTKVLTKDGMEIVRYKESLGSDEVNPGRSRGAHFDSGTVSRTHTVRVGQARLTAAAGLGAPFRVPSGGPSGFCSRPGVPP